MVGQDSEFRKLQVTGGSTIIVSLPKEWVKSNDLKKGDVVSLEELASGDLRLSPLQGPAMKQIVSIDCCTYETGLIDLMIGAYLSGADVIKVSCEGEISSRTLLHPSMVENHSTCPIAIRFNGLLCHRPLHPCGPLEK